MGFFSDLKDDLSQAVNELMPEEGAEEVEAKKNAEAGEAADDGADAVRETEKAEESSTVNGFDADLGAMLDNVDNLSATKESAYTQPAEKAEMPSSSGKRPSDEVSTLTESMIINGNIATEGALDVRGSIVGNVEALGKLNITGTIQGNSQAAEIYAEGAKITGELKSSGSIKVGQSTVIIGNLYANSAVIAGAIKGDIDVKGPVVLDSSAIVMGDIKSKSVQINNGAVIEGMCSQCYAEVNPTSFFEEIKKMK